MNEYETMDLTELHN